MYARDVAASRAAVAALTRSRSRGRSALIVSIAVVGTLGAGAGALAVGTAAAPTIARLRTSVVSDDCTPLPAGWRCTRNLDGTIRAAHPTAAWDRDATRLPAGLSYEITPGSNTIVAASSAP